MKSSVGIGDSMVAGLIACFVLGLSSADTPGLAVACGSGTVQQPGTKLFIGGMVTALAPTIKIRTMRILISGSNSIKEAWKQ